MGSFICILYSNCLEGGGRNLIWFFYTNCLEEGGNLICIFLTIVFSFFPLMCSSCSVRREERERRDESPILLTLKLKEIFMYFQHTSFEDLLKGFSTVIYSCITGSKWRTQRGGSVGAHPPESEKMYGFKEVPPWTETSPLSLKNFLRTPM